MGQNRGYLASFINSDVIFLETMSSCVFWVPAR